ncbi:hypothetical protein [Gilliamella apicola]|uniref:hypothetical protein n=1 Tax=Gilliamella apicola TaxID=1196095 RepID=UPI002FEE47AF
MDSRSYTTESKRDSVSKIEVKPYSPLYATEICDLFHSTIHAIDTDIYSKAEQEAWCPTPPDYTCILTFKNVA